MFKKKSVVTSLVAVGVLGIFLPIVAQAEAGSKSDASVTVTEPAESGSLRFEAPEKLNITFSDMEISSKTLKEIETRGIGEKEGTKAHVKVVDDRKNIKGDPIFFVTARMSEQYGDKDFLRNGMYVSMQTDTNEGVYPVDLELDGGRETIVTTGSKEFPVDHDLNARLRIIGNALDITPGNYGTSIIWSAVPEIK